MRSNYFYDDITNVMVAEATIEAETAKIKKSKRGIIASIISMVMWLAGLGLGCLSDIDGLPRPIVDFLQISALGIWLLALITTLVAYLIGGSVGETLKIIGKIGFVGWFIIPFPYDIITGLAAMFLTVVALFACPLLVLGIIHIVRKRRIKKAQQFLDEFASVQERYNMGPAISL